MQRLIAGFLGLIFLVACHSGPPDGIIAKEKMVSVLRDVHLADGYASSVPMDSVKIVRNSLYAGIFKKYGTDSARLRASIEYYSALPQEYDAMYTDVQKELQGLVDAEQKKETEKMRAIQRIDSIRNVRVQDSLRRIERDSADYKLKKHLLYWAETDSAAKPAAWTRETAAADFLRSTWLPSSQQLGINKPAFKASPGRPALVPASVPQPIKPVMPPANPARSPGLKPIRMVPPPIERKKR